MEESLVSAANTTEHKTSHSCILGYTRLISRIGQPVYENELEGNVLRYLRPTKSQMLMGKNFQIHIQMSMVSKMSKCP